MLAERPKKKNMEETLWIQFGKWFREKRRQVEMTQQEAADAANVSRQFLGKLEKGEIGAKRETVKALARAIRADIEEALKRAGFAPTFTITELDIRTQKPLETSEEEKKLLGEFLDMLPDIVEIARKHKQSNDK